MWCGPWARWRAPPGSSASRSSSCRRTVFGPFRCRPIRVCGLLCRDEKRSPSGSRRRGPTPSILRPKGRSATRYGPTAFATAGPSRPATPRGFPNISRPARRSRQQWIYNVLRRFHAAAAATMVATPSLMTELSGARLHQSRHVDARRRRRSVPARSRHRSRFSAADLHDCRADRGGKESRRRFCRSICPAPKSSSAPGPQEAELKRRFPERQIPRPVGQRHSRGASRRRRRLCLSEPHRHVRHRATRGARERRSDRRLSGDRTEGRHRQQSGRRLERGSCAPPAWRRCGFPAKPAANSRCAIPGKTARGNSSVMPTRSPRLPPRMPSRWRRSRSKAMPDPDRKTMCPAATEQHRGSMHEHSV